MAANSATELIRMFSECFSAGDIDGLMGLYEEDAVFPNHHGAFKGAEQIRCITILMARSSPSLKDEPRSAMPMFGSLLLMDPDPGYWTNRPSAAMIARNDIIQRGPA